jgi:flavin-dependent trigonelline monooxygenase, reductase component
MGKVSHRIGQLHDRIEFILMSSQPAGALPPSIAADDFRRACGRFATGVTVASVMDSRDIPHGLTVSSFASVSLDPPLILICLGHQVTVIEAFRAASHFGISVLGEEQRDISEHFARKGHDRFGGVSWHRGMYGAPLIDGVLAAMECELHQRIASGDHDIFVGRMLRAQVREGAPLIHFASRYRGLAK